MYYASYHPYGPGTLNIDGLRTNRLYGYLTKRDRDAAVDNSNGLIVARSRSESEIRKLLARSRRDYGFNITEHILQTDGIDYMESAGR